MGSGLGAPNADDLAAVGPSPGAATTSVADREHRPRREWFTLEAGPTGQHVRLAAPDGHAYTWTL